MNRLVHMCSLLATVSLSLCVCGCKPHQDAETPVEDTSTDPNVQLAHDLENLQPVDPCTQELTQAALSKARNHVLDREPILLYAQIGYPVGGDRPSLGIITCDEDRDVLGIGLCEERPDANGVLAIRTEEYPVFAHRTWRHGLNTSSIPAHLRTTAQQMDAQRWDAFARGEGLDKGRIATGDDDKALLPPIWVSAPDSNDVRVEVYVYDREGNRSNHFPLRKGKQWR